MRFKRRIKRTTKQYIMVCIIAVLIATIAAVAISFKIIDSIKTDYNKKLDEYVNEINENKRMVYRAKEDIKAGDLITLDVVEYLDLFSSQPQEAYIDSTDIGKTVLIDVIKGTHLLKSMVTDVNIENGVREAEFNSIMISTNIIENDVVDVRIAYPNGEDYCVLAKKIIKDYDGERPNCFMWLTEEEIIRMHNAIVDAYLFNGAYLYTVKYIESNLQEATIVTYTPSIQAIELIKNNPNIVNMAAATLNKEVRKALENRLADSLNKNISEHRWDIEDNYLYPDYNINRDTTTEDDLIVSENISQENEYNDAINYDAGDTEYYNSQGEWPETGNAGNIDSIDENVTELGYSTEFTSDYFVMLEE